MTAQDQFGRDVTLHNGNVASRILPIRIHELDQADKAAIETELQSPLRCIDFIFKSPGVNRPITPGSNTVVTSNPNRYYIDGNVYDNWKAVPDKYKVAIVKHENPDQGTLLRFSF